MCYDLNEYDPFEPFIFIEDEDEYVDSIPMNDYNWEEWLDNSY